LQKKISKLESSTSSISRDNSTPLLSKVEHKPPVFAQQSSTKQTASTKEQSGVIEQETAHLYMAYPINPTNTLNSPSPPKLNSNGISQLQPAPNLNEDTDYFNDGYRTEKAMLASLANDQVASSNPEKLSSQLSNIDILNQKSINTEKRVIELEKQLERMKCLLNEVTSNENSTSGAQNDESQTNTITAASSSKPPLPVPVHHNNNMNHNNMYHQSSNHQFQQQQQPPEIFVVEQDEFEVELVDFDEDSRLIDMNNQLYFRESDSFHLPIYTEKVFQN
jgi:hypothetical protein